MLGDFHVHTTMSDGKSSFESNVKQAQKLGFSKLGFSDHYCVNNPIWSMQKKDIPNYLKTISDLNSQYLNNSSLEILKGLEVDFILEKEEQLKQDLSEFDLDYTIGSVHFVNDWNFDVINGDDPNIDVDLAYEIYFNAVWKMIDSELFSFIGHIDVIKKHNLFIEEKKLLKYYQKTSQLLSKTKTLIELNTSGLTKPCQQIYPAIPLLKKIAKNQKQILLNSDSHDYHHLARFFPEMKIILKSIGFKELMYFSKKEAKVLSIL